MIDAGGARPSRTQSMRPLSSARMVQVCGLGFKQPLGAPGQRAELAGVGEREVVGREVVIDLLAPGATGL